MMMIKREFEEWRGREFGQVLLLLEYNIYKKKETVKPVRCIPMNFQK